VRLTQEEQTSGKVVCCRAFSSLPRVRSIKLLPIRKLSAPEIHHKLAQVYRAACRYVLFKQGG